MKKSQIDTEIDKNPKSFQIQRFYAIFPRNFQRTLWIGTLNKVNKERICCPVGFFEDFIAVFWVKMSQIETKNAKKLKVFPFSKCFSIFC